MHHSHKSPPSGPFVHLQGRHHSISIGTIATTFRMDKAHPCHRHGPEVTRVMWKSEEKPHSEIRHTGLNQNGHEVTRRKLYEFPFVVLRTLRGYCFSLMRGNR